jgi:hypothetical protein
VNLLKCSEDPRGKTWFFINFLPYSFRLIGSQTKKRLYPSLVSQNRVKVKYFFDRTRKLQRSWQVILLLQWPNIWFSLSTLTCQQKGTRTSRRSWRASTGIFLLKQMLLITLKLIFFCLLTRK